MKKKTSILLSIMFFTCAAIAQQNNQALLKTPKGKIDQLMDLRFGMFIHFGPVTLRGTEIGWSRGQQVPVAEYDSLYKEFNPALFNADAWVKAAKNAGMKYLTIVAKHHDGFCLWPTAYSTYNISNSPFKRDLVGELAKACKKQGIVFCIYSTVLDWHDADYPIHNPNDKKAVVKGDMRAFVNRMKNELHELITHYHPAMLWFDGYWEEPWTKEYGQEVYRYIKSIDPDVVVNNRLGKGEPTKFSEGSVGDYLTPEQQIGKLDMEHPWESCITICNQWAWKPNDAMKSLKECLQTLSKTAGGNGNLLLNVGPMMDGRMEVRQITRLSEIGSWLKQNGEAIYGTKGGPYKPNDTYTATRKRNKIFIELFKRDGATFNLPALPGIKIKRAYWLGGANLTFTQNLNDEIKIDLPGALPDQNVSVMVLEVDKNAETIPVI